MRELNYPKKKTVRIAIKTFLVLSMDVTFTLNGQLVRLKCDLIDILFNKPSPTVEFSKKRFQSENVYIPRVIDVYKHWQI